MKIRSLSLAACLSLTAWTLPSADAQDDSPTSSSTSSSTGIAVVELFTSQGCSSCPPADSVLRQLESVAAKRDLAVHALSFHVDYWNRLGWKDPYSSEAFSNRQRAYASASGSRRIYTPQMIVNGDTEFVGSNRKQAQVAVTSALAQSADATIELAPSGDDSSRTLSVDYSVDGPIDGRVLNVALVQTPPANKVPRGENAGRVLGHVNVVRSFITVALGEAAGTAKLELPENLDTTETSLIAYVQNPRTLAISGAVSVPWTP